MKTGFNKGEQLFMEGIRLIHFFGPDGAGKTTQVNLLIDFLGKKGIPARKIWMRSPHTGAYILWKFFDKIGFYRIMWNVFDIGIKIPAVDRDPKLKTFWCVLEFFSVLPHILRANYLMSRGYVLVAERYILDTIVTVAFFVNDINFLKTKLARILMRLIPKGTVLIFIDASFEAILKRRAPLFLERVRKAKNSKPNSRRQRVYGYVPDSVVEPREFIDFQRNAYKLLARSIRAYEIYSPSLSVDETFESILRLLKFDQ